MNKTMLITKEQLDLVTEYVSNRLHIVDSSKSRDEKFNIITGEIKVLQQDTKQLQQDTKQLQQDTKQLQQELVHQRELMMTGFNSIDKRLEQNESYFKGMFSFMRWQMGVSTLFLTGLMIQIYLK